MAGKKLDQVKDAMVAIMDELTENVPNCMYVFSYML